MATGLRLRLVGVVAATVMLGVLGLSHANADGMVRSLPEEGTWVKYAIRMQANDATIQGDVRVAVVGKAFTEQGACRWVEARLDVKVPSEGNIKAVGKFLVPESAVERGKDPSKLLVKSWVKMGDGPLTDLAVEPYEPVQHLLKLFAGPPLKDPMELPAIAVANKLGNLDCPGESGQSELNALGAKLKINVEHRWNDKVPFETVEYRVSFKETLPGDNPLEVLIHLTFEDTGTNATSDIPDAQ